MLRSSAQGARHLDNCDWDKTSEMCATCKIALRNELLTLYESFGYTAEDINDEFFYDGWENNFDDWEQDNCNHPRCKCTAPDSTIEDYVDYIPDGIIGPELHQTCKSIIADMASQEPIDWHPGSDNKVRDLIHPSMYCYVRGTSIHNNKFIDAPCPENIRYQWLPSKFTIDHGGKVRVSSYVNNLKPEKYPEFIPMIEQVFEQFVPRLEFILRKPLRSSDLQVIVKVGSINLDTTKPNYQGGSWHVEGMPYEHIAATCIHYVDVENITDSFLEFRKPTIVNEENIDYPQSDAKFTTHHYGIEPGSHHDGIMNRYLGLIRCHECASVIFPNNIQHRVKEFSLKPGASSSLRTILAFFVIDPNERIVSTEDIPPQQSIFTLEDANLHRQRLMFHRKFFVDQLNNDIFERPFSLCEH
jgi:hypothetical protein